VAEGFEERVRAVLAALQPGEVVTYGEVAMEAGFPGAARAVGNLLASSEGLPWWRVVRADGRLAASHPREQAKRLAAEGITTHSGRVVGNVRAAARTEPAVRGRTRR
jgi:methylated-DNA-protein-cysteine methyltransferase-like protein